MNVKILIVDDEQAIRKLLTRYLEDAGYECHTAENVKSAKEALASTTFDLLLCDLKMPGDSGLDLIRYTKEHHPQTGRVMITGFGSPEIASEIMAVGVYGYIIKPATRNVVLITVENALRHRRLDLHMHACKIELEKNISHRTEKLAAIMNNLNVGVVMFDPDMNILELNRRMQQGFPHIAVGKGTPCSHAFNCRRDGYCCDDCPMTVTIRTCKSCESNRILLTAQGERDFRLVTSPIVDNTGKVYAGIALYEDFTEKLLLERDLRQAQKLETVG